MKNNSSFILSSHPGLWIFIAAMMTRLVYFAWSQSSPFLYQLSNDEAFYVEYARAILNGDSYPYANFMDPFIAYLLVAPMYLVDNIHVARLLFLIMDSASAYLVYKVARLLTANKNTGVIAGVIYIFYSLTVIYSVFITKSTPIIFLLLLISFCFLQGINTHQKFYFFLAGICSALLVFLGANFLLLCILYGLLLLVFADWRRFFLHYIYGFLLLIIFHIVFFYMSGEGKSILPTNGGIVFYISNHSGNLSGTHEVPEFVREATPQGIYHAFKEQAKKEIPSIQSDEEVSTFWYKKALMENLNHPSLMLHRLYNKLVFLISNDEISQNYYFPYIKEVTLKNLPLFTFALMLGFGVSGFLVFSVFDKKMALILAPVAVIITTCMLFFVSARMRMPLLPFLIIGCSFWIFALDASFKKQLAGVVIVIALSSFSYSFAYQKDKSAIMQDQYNLAVVMVKAAMFNEAGEIMDRLLKQDKMPKWMLLKALILSNQGRCVEALPLYDQVLQAIPDLPDAKNNRHLCLQFIKNSQ